MCLATTSAVSRAAVFKTRSPLRVLASGAHLKMGRHAQPGAEIGPYVAGAENRDARGTDADVIMSRRLA
jgi:hypothetical protein